MTALVRSAALTHFAELAAACGLEARALVAGVGLQPRCLTDPDLKIPAHLVGRLLETAATQAREPAFGLRLAESRRLSNLGPLALLVRDEPTLRRALEALMLHIHVHNEAVAVHVAEHAGLVVIRTELSADGGRPLRQATELVVGVTFRVLQVFMGAAWRPRLVCFTHSAPPSLAAHRRVLGPAVEFGHEFNGIVCNAADLDAPNPGADPVLARYSRKLLAPTLARSRHLPDRVRQLIVLLLPRGLCRVEVVAQHLGVDRRTVHRQLAAEGTSFSALLDGVRRDLAARYVEGTDRPLTDVAALLGFAAPSAFSRWHAATLG
ncbi:MAG: AraC family transcriptional regulator ligand-binding domain-containing protein, partial [Burkholderiales bacterium]|nr:AraC family transcriptional regulator ligand-binding domain-containing protein [Burkholderiales bacterium]